MKKSLMMTTFMLMLTTAGGTWTAAAEEHAQEGGAAVEAPASEVSDAEAAANKAADDERKAKAARIAATISDLRSEGAASIGPDQKITPEVFKSVCGAVKMKAMELAKSEGVKIRHAAARNRNPENAATEEEISMHLLFTEHPETKELWNKATIDGVAYDRYVRPIYVEPACLACHGEKDNRPEFIQQKYPEDKAFGFNPGDLRGIIEILIPEPLAKQKGE